jgi:hypothetical protein
LLEPLNEVTITHSGVPPFTEQLAEQFVGHTCNRMLDLYVGYDEQALGPSSQDLTFCDNVTYILQHKIPHVTQPYIDDIPVKGPPKRYIKDNREPETIPDNSGIW